MKKINETAKTLKHIKDRAEHVRTRAPKVTPERKDYSHVIDRVSKIRSRRSRKYDPNNGIKGRRNMNRQKKGLPENRYTNAAKFISTMLGKPVKDIVEQANKLNSITPVLMILDRMFEENIDQSNKEDYQSIRDIVYAIYEDKGDIIGPIAVVISDIKGQKSVQESIAAEAKILRRYYSDDSFVWTESIKDSKHNIIKFYVRAALGENIFSAALNEGRVIKKYL